MKQKTKELLALTISDALANLSALADMQIDAKETIGFVKKHKMVIQDEEMSYKTLDWFMADNIGELIENVKDTYQTLLEYLKQIYEKDFIDWDDPKCRKGFQAIMVMITDAANKVDKYLELLPKQSGLMKINDLPVFQELKSFYLEKIAKKFKEALEGDEPWEDQWQNNEKSLLLDIERSGLKDFEMLKKDEEYELFYLVGDDEKPFFDSQLIRNIKLFCDYDQEALKNIEEDPLLKIRIFLDKDFQASSKQILDRSAKVIEKYFKEKYHKNVESELISYINQAIYALMLSSNPKNLIAHSFYKNSIEYFHDFQIFLREIFNSDEYQKVIAYSLSDKRSKCIVELAHLLCKNLFLRTGAIKQEMIGYIHLLIRKGDEIRKFRYPKKSSFWNTILENIESIQILLNSYLSGPLMKLLDVIREEGPFSFDPIMQDNVPMKLFEVDHSMNKLEVIRCPSPTTQYIINHAQIIEEFKGFLRSFDDEKYLFLNLQDRASFKESARCKAIEILQKRADFKNNIAIINFDTHSDFYHQSGIYLNLNKAEDFIKAFKAEMLKKKDEFFENKNIPSSIFEKIWKFIDLALIMVHKYFFVSKNVLTRKNRLDFITIFNNFLVLKLVEIINPKVLSFSCKDAIDIGSVQAASFFAFLKLIKSKSFEKEDGDYFRWIVYAPALLVRERPINPINLMRTISCLNSIDVEMLTHRNQIMKTMSSLYNPSFLKSIKVIER